MTGPTGIHPTLPAEEEGPDRRALELASMCDLVESGVATTVSVTFPQSADAPDISTYAQQITAGRGLVAVVEAGAQAVTVHIRARVAPGLSHG
jgi:hypothetical protein